MSVLYDTEFQHSIRSLYIKGVASRPCTVISTYDPAYNIFDRHKLLKKKFKIFVIYSVSYWLHCRIVSIYLVFLLFFVFFFSMFPFRDSLSPPGIFKPKHPNLAAFSVEDRRPARPLSTWCPDHPPAPPALSGPCPGDPCPSQASPPGPPSPPFDRLCESVDCSTLRRWPVWSNQN